jgi:hypothetical protein
MEDPDEAARGRFALIALSYVGSGITAAARQLGGELVIALLGALA